MLISLTPAETTQAGAHGERVLVRTDVGETGVAEVGPGEVTRRAGQRHPGVVARDSLGRNRRQAEVHNRVAAGGSQAVGRRVAGGKGRSTFDVPLARRPGKDLRRRTGPAQKAGPGGDGVPRPPGSTVLVAGAARGRTHPVGVPRVAAGGGSGAAPPSRPRGLAAAGGFSVAALATTTAAAVMRHDSVGGGLEGEQHAAGRTRATRAAMPGRFRGAGRDRAGNGVSPEGGRGG